MNREELMDLFSEKIWYVCRWIMKKCRRSGCGQRNRF